MANLFKVVFLGVVGFSFLVYLTAEKPQKIEKNDDVINVIKYDSLPDIYELVGQDKIITKNKLFKRNKETLIVVGSHDSLSVLKEFPKFFSINMPYIMVANISSAPWFVKKMFIPSKLEEINQDTNIPMIYDFGGEMVKSLYLNDSSKTKFFAYLLSSEGTITKIYEGYVKEGAIDGTMKRSEMKNVLEPLYKLISK